MWALGALVCDIIQGRGRPVHTWKKLGTCSTYSNEFRPYVTHIMYLESGPHQNWAWTKISPNQKKTCSHLMAKKAKPVAPNLITRMCSRGNGYVAVAVISEIVCVGHCTETILVILKCDQWQRLIIPDLFLRSVPNGCVLSSELCLWITQGFYWEVYTNVWSTLRRVNVIIWCCSMYFLAFKNCVLLSLVGTAESVFCSCELF